MNLLLTKIIFAIVTVSIIITILSHSEIIQDKYGVLSREKTNVLDHVLLFLFAIFFIIVYLLRTKLKT